MQPVVWTFGEVVQIRLKCGTVINARYHSPEFRVVCKHQYVGRDPVSEAHRLNNNDPRQQLSDREYGTPIPYAWRTVSRRLADNFLLYCDPLSSELVAPADVGLRSLPNNCIIPRTPLNRLSAPTVSSLADRLVAFTVDTEVNLCAVPDRRSSLTAIPSIRLLTTESANNHRLFIIRLCPNHPDLTPPFDRQLITDLKIDTCSWSFGTAPMPRNYLLI